MSCHYAGCQDAAAGVADGWSFCKPHMREHSHLTATDVQTAVAKGPLPKPPPPADPWLSRRYGGLRLPSQSWQPVLAVLNRNRRRAA